ncbi:MAG: glycoside hydrolase family 5 protein [Spirochaetia bacterium]
MHLQKWIATVVLVTVSIILLLIALFFAVVYFHDQGKILFPVSVNDEFSLDDDLSYPNQLVVNGSQLYAAGSGPILLQGVNIPDPSRLHNENRFNKRYFQRIFSSGADVIRIPVHPDYWLSDEYYLYRYLDRIVQWCAEANVYCIIDWHAFGNIITGEAENVDYHEFDLKDETYRFWEITSPYFQNAPHVLYELFNEPSGISADDWSTEAHGLASFVRTRAPENVIIVSGTQWSRDLSWVNTNPVEIENIAYTAHIYPAHSQSLWDHWFGTTAENHPVFLTEWGWVPPSVETAQGFLQGTQEGYGEPLMEYAQEHGISWTAWTYDEEWEPQMFYNVENQETTPYGRYVLELLE